MSQIIVQQETRNSRHAEKSNSIEDLCYRIKSNAIHIAVTIVFLAWLAKEVWHALGLPPIPWVRSLFSS